MEHVRYSRDLEGFPVQGFCFSLFPQRGKKDLSWMYWAFPGGTANHGGEIKKDSFHHKEDIQPGCVLKLYRLIMYVSEKLHSLGKKMSSITRPWV